MKKLLLIFAAILVGCGSGDMAGTSTETTNGYTGVVRSSTGARVENAQVSLFNVSTNEVDTTVLSDTRGTFFFEVDYTEEYHLGVEDSSEEAWSYFPFGPSDDTVAVQMQRPGSATLLNGVAQQRYALAGTPFSSDSLAFGELPAGSFSLYDSSVRGKRTLGTFAVQPDSVSLVEVQSVDEGILFEDFNDGDGNSPLYPWRNTGLFWYKEETAEIGFEDRLIADTNGYFVTIPEDDYMLKERHVGIKLGEDLDISMLDSISFRARGEGILRATFSQKIEGSPVTYKKVFFKVTLTSEWTTYTIDLRNHSDVEFQDVSSWDELAASVDFFTLFLFANQREAFVDDICFYGVVVENLIP